MASKIYFFKTGRHTDSSGNTKNWTPADVKTIIEKNTPRARDIPLAIGHPKSDSPAYGWAESFGADAQGAFAMIKENTPEVKNWVDKKFYKKVSVALRPDMTIRHIGLLGATPPAVEGLPEAAFAEGEEIITLEFEEYRVPLIGRILQRLRDFLVEEKGVEAADRIINPWDLEELARTPEPVAGPLFAEDSPEKKAQNARAKKYGIAVKEGGHVTKPSEYESLDDEQFADPVNYKYPIDEANIQAALSYWGMPRNREGYDEEEIKIITGRILKAAKKFDIEVDTEKWNFNQGDDMKTIEELQAEIKKKEEALAEFAEKDKAKDAKLIQLRSDLAAAQKEKREGEYAAFFAPYLKTGHLTPAQNAKGLEFMEALSGAGEYEFAEGDKKGKKTIVAGFQEFLKPLLELLPKQVEFSEVATKGTAGISSEADAVAKGIAAASPKGQ